MEKLKFAIPGCGIWSQFQLGGWHKLDGAECMALYNRTLSKADDLQNDLASLIPSMMLKR